MARYWVNDGGNWNDTAHWSASSGGASGASVPDTVTDVYFDANSFSSASQTVVVNTTAYCQKMDWTGVTNSPQIKSSSTLNIYGSLTLTGMTFDTSGTTGWNLRTSTAGRTITTNSITFPFPLSFSAVQDAGSWTLQDSLTCSSISLIRGILNSNNQTVTTTVGDFTFSGTSAKTLTMGSSTFNLTGRFYLGVNTSSYTINAETSTLNCTGLYCHINNPWNVSLYDVNCILPYQKYPRVIGGDGSGTTDQIKLNKINSFNNLTITQTSSGSYVWQKTLAVELSTDITVDGTLTLTGYSNSRRIFIYSLTEGMQRTITANAVSLINVDFIDIVGAGVAFPFTGTSIGDCGNNSGITCDTPTTRYWVGDAGNWSDTNHWSTGSGGVGGATIPLPQDDVIFDSNSFSLSNQSVTVDMQLLGKNINWTGVTNNPIWDIFYAEDTQTKYILMFGNLTLDSEMTILSQITGNDTYFNLSGRGDFNLTTNGIIIGGTTDNAYSIFSINNGSSGSTTLQDTLNSWQFYVQSGTLNANNQSLNLRNFYLGQYWIGNISYPPTIILNMGSGNWTFNGSVSFSTYTLCYFWWRNATTINCDTSTIIINSNKLSLATPAGFSMRCVNSAPVSNKTFYNIIVYGTDDTTNTFHFRLFYASSGPITMSNLTILSPKISVTFRYYDVYYNNQTIITSTLTAQGSSSNPIIFTSVTSANQKCYLSAAVANLSYITVDHNNALGAAIPFQNYDGVDGGYNTNWQFPTSMIAQSSWY